MIQTVMTHECPQCGGSQLVKNGTTPHGKQKYHCRTCGAYGTLHPQVRYSPARKAEILRAYHERSSLRGLERTFGVARQTVAKWLREEAAALPDSPAIAGAASQDVLELNETWSFVGSKKTSGGFG